MCGVIGYLSLSPTPENFRPVLSLFRESRIRGKHAYGYAAIGGASEALRVRKYPNLADIQADLEKLVLEPPRCLIGHTRYSTSGDYTLPLNNQPVTVPYIDGALVFNGVIDMGTKDEMEQRHAVRLYTANDGELALRWLAESDKRFIPELYSTTGRSFAGLVLSVHKELLVYRNEHRPLYWLDQDGATYFASTRDILRRAGLNADTADEVVPGILWRLQC